MTKAFSINEHKALFEAMAKLTSADDFRLFLEDICTIKEIESMAQRLEVANMLKRGANYQEVSAATGASTATISRVNKCLVYGSGGYDLVLNGEGEKRDD
jgi:TrpR-related protein YerC/YecD